MRKSFDGDTLNSDPQTGQIFVMGIGSIVPGNNAHVQDTAHLQFDSNW